jgi:hypothetical protein
MLIGTAWLLIAMLILAGTVLETWRIAEAMGLWWIWRYHVASEVLILLGAGLAIVGGVGVLREWKRGPLLLESCAWLHGTYWLIYLFGWEEGSHWLRFGRPLAMLAVCAGTIVALRCCRNQPSANFDRGME